MRIEVPDLDSSPAGGAQGFWSSVKASRVLLGLLVEMFVPEGDPLIVGIDETLERRWGKKIAAKGVYIQLPPEMYPPLFTMGE